MWYRTYFPFLVKTILFWRNWANGSLWRVLVWFFSCSGRESGILSHLVYNIRYLERWFLQLVIPFSLQPSELTIVFDLVLIVEMQWTFWKLYHLSYAGQILKSSVFTFIKNSILVCELRKMSRSSGFCCVFVSATPLVLSFQVSGKV